MFSMSLRRGTGDEARLVSINIIVTDHSLGLLTGLAGVEGVGQVETT